MPTLFTPSDPAEIARIITLPEANFETRYITDHKKLKELRDYLGKIGKSVVLTQGVYDLIHEGHALYLEKARSYGDLLIVGMDSDAVTRMRKGPTRPVVPELERARMLSHLRCVDLIYLKKPDQDIDFVIELLRPDVCVMSESTSDFTTKKQKLYKKFCKKLVILPAQATTSTSARIRNLTIEGAQKLSEEINKVVNAFLGHE